MKNLVILAFLLFTMPPACQPTPEPNRWDATKRAWTTPPATDVIRINPTPQGQYGVIYRVIGTADEASLTYANAQGGTEQVTVTPPWQKPLTVQSGQFLYVAAQNEGKTGDVTCEIWVNGEKWKSSTSSAAYGIASCSGSAGE